MSAVKYQDEGELRNVTVERIDKSGRFRLIEHYDENGVCRSKLQRVASSHQNGKRGRPKGMRDVATLLKEVFNAPIPVREGDKRKYLSKAEAMLRNVVAKGLRGEVRALSFLFDLLEKTGWFDEASKENRGRAPGIAHEPLRDMAEWQLLASHYREKLERRRVAALAEARGTRGTSKDQSDSSRKAA